MSKQMIGFLSGLARRAWWMACAASLVPIGFKATDHDMGRWRVTRWTWPETAAPAAALLVVEGTLLLLRRCLCGGHKDRRPAPMPGRRTVCAAV